MRPQEASGIGWSSSLAKDIAGGGSEKGALCLLTSEELPRFCRVGPNPGVLDALSRATESPYTSSGGGAKDQT